MPHHAAPTYIRKGRKIYPADPAVGLASYNCASISEAKRKSSELQKAQGVLGDGYLRVARNNK